MIFLPTAMPSAQTATYTAAMPQYLFPTERAHMIDPLPPARAAWRNRLYQIIFEADTPAGKAFDVGLIVCILVSVALVMLDSVQDIHTRFHQELWVAEWVVTVLFSAEYLARLLLSAPRPWAYARNLFGVIDLLSILPHY